MSEFFLGRREQHAMCEEDSWATLGTKSMAVDGFIIGKDIKCSTNFNHNWKEILAAGADSRDIDSMEKGEVSYGFTLTFVPTNWKFLRYAGYATVTNTDSGSYYTHTFTQTDAAKSFTYEWSQRGSTDHVLTFTGCVIKKCTISFVKGEVVQVVAECLAKSVSAGTSTTSVSTNTDDAFQFRMAKLTYAGSEVTEVNSGELVIDNGIDEEDSRYCNSTLDQEIGEPIPKIARRSCRFNLNIKDDTFYDDWADEAVVPSTNKLELTRGSNDDCVLTFTSVYLNPGPQAPTNIEGVNNVDVVGVIKTLGIVAKDQLSDY